MSSNEPNASIPPTENLSFYNSKNFINPTESVTQSQLSNTKFDIINTIRTEDLYVDKLELGINSSATGTDSTALGKGATASGANSTAIGQGATASVNNLMVLGTTATHYRLAGFANNIMVRKTNTGISNQVADFGATQIDWQQGDATSDFGWEWNSGNKWFVNNSGRQMNVLVSFNLTTEPWTDTRGAVLAYIRSNNEYYYNTINSNYSYINGISGTHIITVPNGGTITTFWGVRYTSGIAKYLTATTTPSATYKDNQIKIVALD